ncbi:MAG TPA: thioredoxin domain-containing protein [Stellaceae bacterium]|nr:thioredoxin domain-containing protein [Stellaceae bacterium]
MAGNLLGRETSPYLLQHKDNPVAWRPWGAEALTEARSQDKPILLSVGYAACHWCHVMAHESFENPEIAARMNELFVPIKVDREERPDIDAIYQQALMLLGGQGGWPLTMFLTPEGKPFWGGTYFPPAPRQGRPGFADILEGVGDIYRNQKPQMEHNVQALAEGLEKLSRSLSGGIIEADLLDRIAQRIHQMIDPAEGGLRGAPKFPQCGLLELLWRGYRRRHDAGLRDAVLLSLERMSQGGIYDHLGGGYARYSTDAIWLVQHFEKMLYDNAQLIPLLAWAWVETGKPIFKLRVEETIAWLEREMVLPGGGLAATLDADSEHEEGKFYVWSESEIESVLDAAGLGSLIPSFKTHYDVSAGGNWEGKTILNRSAKPDFLDAAAEAELARCREALLAARGHRIRPGLDDKVLADWNGMAIAALVLAAGIFERPDWLVLARNAWDFAMANLVPAPDRLSHSWCGGRVHPATLDDYAQMSRAGLALFEATDEARYLDQVRRWMATLDAHYRDAADGGYFLVADDTADVILRTKGVEDGAVPSGNGAMVEVLARLALLTGDPAFEARAETQLQAFSGEIERNIFGLGTLLNGADILNRALQIVVAGDPDASDTRTLVLAARRHAAPGRVLSVVGPGKALAADHPAAGKAPIEGKAAAYVCRGRICSAPVTDPEKLAQMLAD